ncbi:MAG: CRISPR-associated endonuclease Cas2 [Proteobacteria bacterium]|nr:CRISPR-associated endonuclease Cas2 [Pseudomonadota bacterium]
MQRYIVTYDVCDPKRLRRAFEVLRGFGDHLQYSVFRCDLSQQALVELKAELHAVIDHDEDQVLLFDLGPAPGRGASSVEALGRPYREATKTCTVI